MHSRAAVNWPIGESQLEARHGKSLSRPEALQFRATHLVKAELPSHLTPNYPYVVEGQARIKSDSIGIWRRWAIGATLFMTGRPIADK